MNGIEELHASHDVNLPQEVDAAQQQWHMWHERRLEELHAPHGYLACASITWLSDGQEAVVEGVPGIWKAQGDTLVYVPERSAAVQVRNAGRTVEAPVAFRATAFGEEALGYFIVGDLRVEINAQSDAKKRDMHHFWIRVKDPNMPSRAQFTDVPAFPYDARWRIPARFRRAENDELDIHDSVVTTVLQSYPALGVVEFAYGGKEYSLVVCDVFGHVTVFFSDETSGLSTYGIGRVLHLDPLHLDEMKEIDFNYAFNYPCAFSPYCTCPIPSARNRLDFAVEAGEKTPDNAAIYSSIGE